MIVNLLMMIFPRDCFDYSYMLNNIGSGKTNFYYCKCEGFRGLPRVAENIFDKMQFNLGSLAHFQP